MVQWLITACLSLTHPFYVSVVDVNHNAPEKSLEISVRVFYDDFEKALNSHFKTTTDLLNPKTKEQSDKLIKAYIQKNMQLVVDGKVVAMNYLGFEQQKESIWAYLEVSNIADFKKIDINCSLLYDYQQQQSNILHVKKAKNDQSYKLDYPKASYSFVF